MQIEQAPVRSGVFSAEGEIKLMMVTTSNTPPIIPSSDIVIGQHSDEIDAAKSKGMCSIMQYRFSDFWVSISSDNSVLVQDRDREMVVIYGFENQEQANQFAINQDFGEKNNTFQAKHPELNLCWCWIF